MFEIVEGSHAGHKVVRDMWGINFCGRDPETAFYCLDCSDPLVAQQSVQLTDGGRRIATGQSGEYRAEVATRKAKGN